MVSSPHTHTHTHSLAGSVTINAKTTLHCSPGSSMLLRKCSSVANQFCLCAWQCELGSCRVQTDANWPVFDFCNQFLQGDRQCYYFLGYFLICCEANRNLDSNTEAGKDADPGALAGTDCFSPDLSAHLFKQKPLKFLSFLP